jgi:hypothetical protein
MRVVPLWITAMDMVVPVLEFWGVSINSLAFRHIHVGAQVVLERGQNRRI